MPIYVVDPSVFSAQGGVIAWANVAKVLGIASPPNSPFQSSIELRWMLDASLGLPTEPFMVWTRPHLANVPLQPLTITQQQLFFEFNNTLITWTQGRMSSVSVDVQAPAGGTLFACVGAPILGNVVALTSIAAGNSTVSLSAKFIDSLMVSAGVTVLAVRGVGSGGYANLPGWTPVELVGLPVQQTQWSGIGKHGEPQGMLTAITDAQTAAVQRLTRGAPPFGWGPLIAAGVPAPAWVAPSFGPLVAEVNGNLLNYLHDIARNFPPNQQAGQTVTVPLPPPKNSMGQSTNKPGTTTQLSPLPMTYMAGGTDPFLSLVLGFGTAYPFSPAVTGAGGGSFADFMITAHWDKGFDGVSPPVDLAAIVPVTGTVLPPPTPANVATDVLGMLRPLVSDGNWRSAVRVSWDRPPAMQLTHVASFAAARVGTSPAAPAIALMQARPSGGYRMIAVNVAADPPDPQGWRMHGIDTEVEIPSNPGTRTLKYGAAAQDIFGQWTPWAAADQALTQPDLEAVRISGAKLSPMAPAMGSVCTTTLEMDFIWDWRIRAAKQITFVGRLYAAATHGDPPPSVVIPAGLDRSVGGGGAAVVVTFAGDTPSSPGVTIIPVTEDGENQAAGFGPAQGDTRRYRMTITGLQLDFGPTPFIGLAVWAQGQENIAPQRLSPWPSAPIVISTGDPRPPVVPVAHVQLGSIPDAAGASHVQISWTAQPNAAGYFVYESTETTLLDEWGLPEPQQSDTLDARLLVLKNNFKANPVRRPFTRFNAKAMQSTSTDITLPKGSTSIHLYVVLGISAGQVESDWPSGPNADQALIAIAAPHITRPAAPMIEARQFFDPAAMPPAFKAQLVITTRPGPRPKTIEIHRVRVDDAAKELDTMGPPIARLKATSGPWNVTTTPDANYGAYITQVQGADAPTGSWKRVWYRATAWTDQDDTRGGLKGRSSASNAAWVVLPPTDPPVLSALSMGGGPNPPDAILEWTCVSPRKRTPLGPHLISARATLAGSNPKTTTPLLSLDTALDTMDNVQPASGSGVWVVGTVSGVTTYRAIIRRAAVTDTVNFAVRITDPLGRTGAQLLTIASGPVDPPPDLQNLKFQKVPAPPPPHVVLRFTSASPVKAPLSGPYVLTVTGVPTVPVLFPPPLHFSMPLGSVPTKLPIGPPPASYILRSGAGPTFSYGVLSTQNLKGFVVRITAPNGQFVEKTV
jgi:hypothetical protein